MSADVRIVGGDLPDEVVRQAAALHRRQIPDGFISSLGPDFLGRVVRNVADSEHGIALVALEEERVRGLLLGAVTAGGLFRDFLVHHGLGAARDVLAHLVRPAVWRKIFESLFYPARRPGEELPEPELLDLAVDEESVGTGLAGRLFAAFAEELRGRGADGFRITTGASLERARGFYEKMGAERVAEMEIHRGERTLVYRYRIPEGGAGPPAGAR